MISDIKNTGLRMADNYPAGAFMTIEREANKSEKDSKSLMDMEYRIQDLINDVREDQAQRLPTQLAGHIRQAFNAAETAKTSDGIDSLLDSCLRARKGEYDPDDLRKIREQTPGGSEIYMMLSNNKSRACEAILKNSLLPAGVDKPWRLDPSPVPDLPEATRIEIESQVQTETVEMMQGPDGIFSVDEVQVQSRLDELRKKVMTEAYRMAKNQTEIIEKYVEDQLVQGEFYQELAKFLNDVSIFPTAFLKGPITRKIPVVAWEDEAYGEKSIKTVLKSTRKYDRVSPYDLFFAPGARNIQDGYVIQRHRMRLSELQSYIGVEGFDEQAIRAVLAEYGTGGLTEWLASDSTRDLVEGRTAAETDPDPQIDALEYWGTVQGKALIEWGMSPKEIKDPEFAYKITSWLIGDWVIMARLNAHPLGHNPYFSASFSYNNDSIWGESPVMLMKSEQKACNATARSLFNRMAFASGPIVEILWDRLAPGENPTEIKPWMLIRTRSDINSPSQAVYLTEFNPYSNIFLQVYQHFARQASETTGIPDYMSGSDQGANPTASGFSMQINNMNAMMRNVVMGIDDNVIKKVIYEHWLSIMLYDDEVPKIGDINIRARASDYIIAQEQLQLRRNEFMQTALHPEILKIIGAQGLGNILRENVASLKYDSNIVPTEDEISENLSKDMIIQQLTEQLNQLLGGGAIPPNMGQGRLPAPKKGGETQDLAGGAKGRESGRLMANG